MLSPRMQIPLLKVLLGGLLLSGVAEGVPEEWAVLLESYCFDCHDGASKKGGVDFEAVLEDEQALEKHSEVWERAVRQLQARMMPPIGKKRPSEAAYDKFTGSLIETLDAQAEKHPNPGRTESLRRLTRSEYQNVIRDLLAVEVDARTLLPPDQSSHGFDNITVGDLSPALLDRYISAAQKISRLALGRTGSSPDGRTVRVRPDVTQDGHVAGLPLGTRGGTLIEHTFPQDGEYQVRVHLMRDRDEKVEGMRGVHELQVLLDDELAASFEVRPPKNRSDHTKIDAHLSGRIEVAAGRRRLGVTFVEPVPDLQETLRQPYESAFNTHRHPRRAPAVYQVSITGPFKSNGTGETESRRRVLGTFAKQDGAGAKAVLRPLLRRAYRGRVDEGDLARAMVFYRDGQATGGFEGGLEAALAAVLVSPKFLFRVERDPKDGARDMPYRLSDLELATRLSFFLWSSIPDEPLLDAAEAGELRTAEGVSEQVQRMLADGRSRSLVENFASQWLYLRNLDSFTPDGRLYPDFDDNLRQAMRRETELLFGSVVREDRSVLDLLHTDHTFLNERLAKHYGVPHVYGERFRKVTLGEGAMRGGILRHASILTVTSYANRTSPVLRGHWVLKNLLGTPPPPPPPNIPALEEAKIDASLPIRQRLAAHRADKACAGCHAPMDPIGFAFENFDAIGQWRTHEGESVVDASGKLPDGTEIRGVAGLERGLLKRPDLFARTLTEKLLTFALGRGIEPNDGPAVRKIVREAASEDYRFSAIILRIVSSEPFTMRMTSHLER